MNYNALLDLATDLGYELAMSGAETYRVEESVNRILNAYGLEPETFVIPNCMIVSIETPDGIPITRMRRVGTHGTDLDTVERFSGLSRAICNRTPSPEEGAEWLKYVRSTCRSYRFAVHLLGNFIGAFGFCLFFGGTALDAIWSGLCGISIGLVSSYMNTLKANPFFSTICSSFIMSLLAYSVFGLGLTDNADTVIIGALMILVPGLLFTNAMRDIIYGDTNSGINRIVQVLLIAMAIALSTAAAWRVTGLIWSHPATSDVLSYSFFLQCAFSFIGCVGFSILYNVHSFGILLCAMGGMFTWAVYLIAEQLGCGIFEANFWAAVFASTYSETMARVRKFPAITYLVVSIFPLLPGAGIYYTMRYALDRSMTTALYKGLETAGIAGVMAVGIILVSTAVRLWTTHRNRQRSTQLK